jgi:asparaginyl-tRNA synthetase
MKHEDIKLINTEDRYIGMNVDVCGWVKTIRTSKNMCFVEINDGTSLKNLQLVVNNNDLKNMNILSKLNLGSSIAVNGVVVNSMNQNQKVELEVKEVKLIGDCPQDYPIQKKKQNLDYLREYPHLRTRTNTFNAVFRVRSVLAKAIHDYFQANNFIYINTPIITGSDCEGAGEMFKVTTLDINKVSYESYNSKIYDNDFFGKKVGLTVSGQLEAEAMACSLGKVYTFGPSFRAENSNTKRHAAEFWLIEPEVAFADLNDIIPVVDEIVKFVIKKVLIECPDEVEFFTKYYDKSLFDRLINVTESDFDCLDYTDAIKILKASNVNFEFPVYWGCDLKSEHLRYLTDVIYKKPIFLINYPKELKPFYVKINSDNKTVASADLYFPRIGDIIGACQKEDNFEILNKRIKELKMTEEDYYWYLDLRKYGTVPHSGFGIGLERLVMYVTGMDNIRDTIIFPRTKCKKLKL